MERTFARLRPALFALGVCMCASSVAPAQAITTTQDRALAKLEANLAKNPNAFKAVRAVGLKLFELKRFADARPVLEKARELRPTDGLSALYAGMAAEEMKDLSAAKTAYTKYLEVGKTRKTKEAIRQRLVAIASAELKQAAAAAVANEQALRGQVVDGKTVAVLPFNCACADSTLLPLGRGMAELVVSDLAISNQLRVLERDRMQAIADEIRLSSSTQADPNTAARAGKLIQAGTIMNGTILIPLNADVSVAGSLVNTQSSVPSGVQSATGRLDALFNLEKAFVRNTFNALGVTLTPQQVALFETRPTQNFNAFLEFSRGLMASDAGQLQEAQRYFEAARSLDPGFGIALQRAQQAAQGQAGAQVTSATVSQGMRNSAEGQVVAAASRGSTSDATSSVTLANVVADVNPTTTNNVQNNTTPSGGSGGTGTTTTNTPTTQNTVSQATGGDQPAQRTGQVTIVIKKP